MKNLTRRVPAPLSAPDVDEEEHRDEHDLPEDVEHHVVEREEHADHPDLEQRDQEEEHLRPGRPASTSRSRTGTAAARRGRRAASTARRRPGGSACRSPAPTAWSSTSCMAVAPSRKFKSMRVGHAEDDPRADDARTILMAALLGAGISSSTTASTAGMATMTAARRREFRSSGHQPRHIEDERCRDTQHEQRVVRDQSRSGACAGARPARSSRRRRRRHARSTPPVSSPSNIRATPARHAELADPAVDDAAVEGGERLGRGGGALHEDRHVHGVDVRRAQPVRDLEDGCRRRASR